MSEKLAANSTISRYRVTCKIGSGGMGEVYLAHDMRLNRRVALKVLPAEVVNNRNRLQRFEQEAQAASALNHPNIITIHEIAVEGDTHFIATEFIEGETLRRRLQTSRVSIDETLNITIQIAAALDAAHRSGIVHRDIKPENIMVREDGLVKVLDFGLAKSTENKLADVDTEAATRAQVTTQAGMILGTAAYMSPEQARGKTVDARSDIWSSGVVLYEMLTGHLPFLGRFFAGGKITEEELKKSIHYYQQAIEKDPNYALAYVGMARSYLTLGHVWGFLPPRETFPNGKAALMKALEIDETLGDAHTALADYYFSYEWNWWRLNKSSRGLLRSIPMMLQHMVAMAGTFKQWNDLMKP